MTKTDPAPTVEITKFEIEIPASEFARLIRPILPLVNKDGWVPLLTGIMLETIGGHLVASGTDRYRGGFSREKVAGVPDGLRMVIRANDLKHALTIFKPTRTHDPALRLTFDQSDMNAPTLAVAGTGGLFDFEATLRYRALVGTFPNLTHVITKAAATEEKPSIAVAMNAAHLADFAKAVRGTDHLIIRHYAPHRPVVVLAGDYFAAVIMPVKVHAEAYDEALAEWSAMLDNTTTTESEKS